LRRDVQLWELSLLQIRATGNSRSETGKLPRPVPKFPFLKYSKTGHNQTFRSVNSSIVLQVFRGMHSAGLQTAVFIIEQIINKQNSVL